eukprot:SAG11_NODE_136_length_15118_cov_14.188495_23_plen_36_part_00
MTAVGMYSGGGDLDDVELRRQKLIHIYNRYIFTIG